MDWPGDPGYPWVLHTPDDRTNVQHVAVSSGASGIGVAGAAVGVTLVRRSPDLHTRGAFRDRKHRSRNTTPRAREATRDPCPVRVHTGTESVRQGGLHRARPAVSSGVDSSRSRTRSAPAAPRGRIPAHTRRDSNSRRAPPRADHPTSPRITQDDPGNPSRSETLQAFPAASISATSASPLVPRSGSSSPSNASTHVRRTAGSPHVGAAAPNSKQETDATAPIVGSLAAVISAVKPPRPWPMRASRAGSAPCARSRNPHVCPDRAPVNQLLPDS